MERNITLDYFKLFLCFLVILIHIQPITGVWNSLGSYMISNGYARIAVPCFFVINGYFLYPKITDLSKVCRYLGKIITVYVVWFSIYLSLTPDKSFDFSHYLLLFFMGNGNLWYVAALILGVVLYYFLIKVSRKNVFLFVCALFLFLSGYYIQFLLKIDLVNEFDKFQMLHVIRCRNALFLGLPFIILGGIIKSKNDNLIKLPNTVIVLVLLASLIFLTIESYYSYSTYYASDFYLALFVLSPSLFVLTLKYSKYSNTSDFVGHLSQAVYFVHPLVLCFSYTLFSINQFGTNKILYIPIICFLCLLLSTGIIQLNKHFKIFL